MSKARKVYVVTAGSYSDYRILAVFDDRAAAEQACDAESEWDRGQVEEWPLRHECPDKMVIHSVVRMHGQPEYEETWVGYEWDWSGWGLPRPGIPFVKRRKGKTLDTSLLMVYAFDKELARKVFDTQWGLWEAEFAGLT
jgi:hypothetical protein